MGYVKDIFTEAAEELEFLAASSNFSTILVIQEFLEGKVGSTDGILPRHLEATLLEAQDMFLETWNGILRDLEEDRAGA